MDIPPNIPKVTPRTQLLGNTLKEYRPADSVPRIPDDGDRAEAAHHALRHALQVAAFLALDADPGFYPRLIVILAELERTIADADAELQGNRRRP
jgi:hypothetical protein